MCLAHVRPPSNVKIIGEYSSLHAQHALRLNDLPQFDARSSSRMGYDWLADPTSSKTATSLVAVDDMVISLASNTLESRCEYAVLMPKVR